MAPLLVPPLLGRCRGTSGLCRACKRRARNSVQGALSLSKLCQQHHRAMQARMGLRSACAWTSLQMQVVALDHRRAHFLRACDDCERNARTINVLPTAALRPVPPAWPYAGLVVTSICLSRWRSHGSLAELRRCSQVLSQLIGDRLSLKAPLLQASHLPIKHLRPHHADMMVLRQCSTASWQES